MIEHADKDAKTYITSNELGGAFGAAFGANTNMKGRINLPYSNKDEDNISISATDTAPFELDTDHEVYWSVPVATPLTGLIVLSDVNVKLGTTMTAAVTYLGAEMYVGGLFNSGTTNWNGYYGATGTRVAEHYLTY